MSIQFTAKEETEENVQVGDAEAYKEAYISLSYLLNTFFQKLSAKKWRN